MTIRLDTHLRSISALYYRPGLPGSRLNCRRAGSIQLRQSARASQISRRGASKSDVDDGRDHACARRGGEPVHCTGAPGAGAARRGVRAPGRAARPQEKRQAPRRQPGVRQDPRAAPPRRPRHLRVRRHRPVRRGRRAGERRRRGWRPAAAGRPIRARHAPLLDRLHRRQVLAGAGRRLAGADRGRTRAGRGRHPRRAKPPGGGVQGPQQRRGFLLRPRRGAGPPGPGTRLLPAGAQGLRAAPRPLPHRRVHDAAPGRVEPALRRAPRSQAHPAGHGQGGAVHEVPPGNVRGPRVMNDLAPLLLFCYALYYVHPIVCVTCLILLICGICTLLSYIVTAYK